MKRILIVGLLVVLVACLVLAGVAWQGARQMGIHLWDEGQVPSITVSGGLRPVISFTPSAAYELFVYEGGPGGFENNLLSPVTYGVPPQGSEVGEAPPLEAGKTYTISIFRKDPLGGGDGFSNTRHRYVGTMTFVATDE